MSTPPSGPPINPFPPPPGPVACDVPQPDPQPQPDDLADPDETE